MEENAAYLSYADRLLVTFEDNVTDYQKELIQRYYDFDEETLNFKFKVADLAEENGQKTHEFTTFVQQNSTATFLLGPCKLCRLEKVVNIGSKSQLRQLFNPFYGSEFLSKEVCEGCMPQYLDNEKKQAEEAQIEREKKHKTRRLQALNNHRIALATSLQHLEQIDAISVYKQELSQVHQEFLIDIARSESRSNAFSTLFNRPDVKAMRNINYLWDILTDLEYRNLLFLERNEDGKILEFHLQPKLRKFLCSRDATPYEDMQPFEQSSNRIQLVLNANVPILDNSEPQSTFAGYFSPNENIKLHKGEVFGYGGWQKKNGTMFFEIRQLTIESPKDWPEPDEKGINTQEVGFPE